MISSPEAGFLPGALELSYGEQVEKAVSNIHSRRLERSLPNTGVITALGDSALERPWSAYMDMMDGIDSAHAAVYEDRRDAATLYVRFKDFDPDIAPDPYSALDPRDSFQTVTHRMLAGMHGKYVPEIEKVDQDPRMLRIFNYTYADASTAGRVATSLLRKQFMAEMGHQNMWAIQTTSVGDLRRQGVIGKLPDELQARIEGFYERHGQAADKLLLSSGNLGIIGREMRDALGPTVPLAIQRPKDNRPALEKHVDYLAVGDIPVSVNRLGHTLVTQAVNQFLNFVAPIRRREVDGGKNLADFVTSAGTTEAAAVIVRAVLTTTAANGIAIKNKVIDRHLREAYIPADD